MRVKNLIGTSPRNCNCGSWLQHWKNFSDQTATICRALGCSRKDIVGAHVQKDVPYDKNWYIVPLCNQCNRLTTPVELVSGTVLVSANISQTCGR